MKHEEIHAFTGSLLTVRENVEHEYNSNTSDENMSDSGSNATSNNSGDFSVIPHGDEYDASNRPYLGVFEGPEKTLEVVFRPIKDQPFDANNTGGMLGLRRLPKEDLDIVCGKARCTIMSKISNHYLDAYVLSESSLFVYPHMVVLKTCGTTTLLRCIAKLIELGAKVGLEISWIGYSRKNLSFPSDQLYPHNSFDQEIAYIGSHRHLAENLNGNAYTLGPVTSDHWFVYVADKTKRDDEFSDSDRVLNIMMFDIAEDVAKKFYYDQYKKDLDDNETCTKEEKELKISKMMTKNVGIDALVPGALIDPRAFEPCGYSMNAILFRSYSTMHVTPEDGSSYASFETNQKASSYTALINNVVSTFKPKRFVLTLMADEPALAHIKNCPLFPNSLSAVYIPTGKVGETMDYKRKNLASIQVEDDCVCMMANFVREDTKFTDRELAQMSEKMRTSKVRGMSIDDYT